MTRMPKYRVYAVIDATKYVGEFEAENEENAEDLAWDNGDFHVSICHHCASEVEIGDPIRMVVEEVEE